MDQISEVKKIPLNRIRQSPVAAAGEALKKNEGLVLPMTLRNGGDYLGTFSRRERKDRKERIVAEGRDHEGRG